MPPLDGQDDEVECVPGLDLDPGRCRGGPRRRARRTPSPRRPRARTPVPHRTPPVPTRPRPPSAGRRAARAGTTSASARPPLHARLVEQVDTVKMQEIEEVRPELRVFALRRVPPGRTSPGTAAADRGRRARSPRRRARCRVPAARGRRPPPRQPRGDVVQAPGEHRDVIAVAMNLDADAVELRVDDRGQAGGLDRFGDRRRGLGEHRRERPTDLQPDTPRAPRVPPSSAAAATVLRSPDSSSARRTIATSIPAARAIASTSRPACAPCRSSPLIRPTKHPLLGLRWPRRTGRTSSSRRRPCGSGAGLRADLGQGGVDLADAERRFGGRLRQVAQRRPTHPDLPLSQLAGEVGGAGRDLCRLVPQAPQRRRQQIDLDQAFRGRANRQRRLGELGELHPPIFSASPDKPTTIPARAFALAFRRILA